jgi:hypothetical protein
MLCSITIVTILSSSIIFNSVIRKDLRGRDRLVTGFTTTYAISTYHHKRYEIESSSSDTTLCDKVCQ